MAILKQFTVKIFLCSLLVACLVSAGNVQAATLHVDDDATCPGSGTVTDPYCMIQDAINAALDGDEVLVHDGTYKENISYLGKAITVNSENGPDVTIIDGNQQGSVVSFKTGEKNDSILDGFTITGGASNYGGGIFFGESINPVVRNCIITNNSAGLGGGIHSRCVSPIITNCIIKDNNGGGIYGYSPFKITGCVIRDNKSNKGGGLFIAYNSTISDSIISGNEASLDGGGIYIYGFSGKFINCTISGNLSNQDGGGVAGKGVISGAFINCIISGNSAKHRGGGMHFRVHNQSEYGDSSPQITNCTISGNWAYNGGGGIYCDFMDASHKYIPVVVNSILWGNIATFSNQFNEVVVFGNLTNTELYLDLNYSNFNPSYIYGSWQGSNNINSDPLFVDPRPASEVPTTEGDYHLKPTSPCTDIGTGNTITYPNLPTDDIDGNPRPLGTGYDMGADEVLCPDKDGDGYHPQNKFIRSVKCSREADCDDNDPAIHPGAPDPCSGDGVDNDCDGDIDEGIVYFHDVDGDGYGTPDDTIEACTIPQGYVSGNNDCNDSDPAIHPGAPEICCDNIDNNCDYKFCLNSQPTKCSFFRDADNDGYGDPNDMKLSYEPPEGYVGDSSDCDDNNPAIHPGVPDPCFSDEKDNNCNGIIDEGIIYYRDADNDGYGNFNITERSCEIIESYVTDNTDCDDSNSAIHPGAYEICGDGIDNDCNHSRYIGKTYYLDMDRDGYGDPENEKTSCEPLEGYVLDKTDCDDSDSSIHPGAPEICDGIDNNCDGQVDEDFADADGDHVADCLDNCPDDANPDQADRDGDGTGDICDSGPATLNVGAGQTYSTIQAAIDAALDGDDVLVHDGTYRELLTFDGNKKITVRSVNGPDKTILNGDTDNDGTGDGRVVTFQSGCKSTLNGITITKGSGGIYCFSSSSPKIIKCKIIDNSAEKGGGIYCAPFSSSTINSCTISRNTATIHGGGVYCWHSLPTFTNCIVNDNSASSCGGGFYFCDVGTPTIINSTISGNRAGSVGGGIACNYHLQSGSSATNPTVVNESLSSSSGIIIMPPTPILSINIINSIFWNNAAEENNNEIYLGDYSYIDMTYSDILGGWEGEGNIDADPLFVDQANGDYYLKPGSPCIDLGTGDTETYSNLPTDDIDGYFRPFGAGYDMGAYEYRPLMFAVNINLNEEPIEICFSPDQPLKANPIVTFEAGGGILKTLDDTPIPLQGAGVEIPPTDDPCSDIPEYYIYCVDYSNETDGEEITIQIEEGDPPIIAGNPGFEVAHFIVDTDHDRATSFCIYNNEAGGGSLLDDNCESDNAVDIDFEAGDLSNLGSGCNVVTIVEIDPASVPAPPGGIIAMMYNIELPDGVEVADGQTVTVTLAFELTDGSIRTDYDSGAKTFEILYFDDATGSWKSDGITFNYDTDVQWNSDNVSGTATFETAHFTVFSVSSKSNGSGSVGDSDSGTQAASSSGCSLAINNSNMSMDSVFANALIFLLPLIIFKVKTKKR